MADGGAAAERGHALTVGYAVEPGKSHRFFDAFRRHPGCADFVFREIPALGGPAADLGGSALRLPPASLYVHKLASYEPNAVVHALAAVPSVPVLDPVPSVAVLEDRAATSVALEAAFASEAMGHMLSSTPHASPHAGTPSPGHGSTSHGAADAGASFELLVPPCAIVAPFMTDEDIADVMEVHECRYPLVLKHRHARDHSQVVICRDVQQLRRAISEGAHPSRAIDASWGATTLTSSDRSWLAVRDSPAADPHVAAGGTDEHASRQFFVQNFIPHNGAIWKVCVIGQNIVMSLRRSVSADHEGAVGRVSKDPLADADPGAAAVLPPFLQHAAIRAADCISSRLKLSLFNFDMLVDASAGAEAYRVYVVDVNYFPSFDTVPRRFDVLADHMRRSAAKRSSVADALVSYPGVPAWAAGAIPIHTFILRAVATLSEPAAEIPKPVQAPSKPLATLAAPAAPQPRNKLAAESLSVARRSRAPAVAPPVANSESRYCVPSEEFYCAAAVVAIAALWVLHRSRPVPSC